MSASSRPSTRTRPDFGDVGGHGDLGGHLVVERGQGEAALVVGLDEHAGEDRHGRTRRQATGHPGHGVGEHVAVDPELHVVPALRGLNERAAGHRAASSRPAGSARLGLRTLVSRTDAHHNSPPRPVRPRFLRPAVLHTRTRGHRITGRTRRRHRGCAHGGQPASAQVNGRRPCAPTRCTSCGQLGSRWTTAGRPQGSVGARGRPHRLWRLVPRLSTGAVDTVVSCAERAAAKAGCGDPPAAVHRVVHRMWRTGGFPTKPARRIRGWAVDNRGVGWGQRYFFDCCLIRLVSSVTWL